MTRGLIGALLLAFSLGGVPRVAAQARAGEPDERTPAQLVADLLGDDKALRDEAMGRLEEMGAAAVPALVNELRRGEAPYAAYVLARIGAAAEPALPVLRERLKGDPPEGFMYAVAIARIKPTEASDVVPVLVAALDDTPGVATMSAYALGRVGTPPAVQALAARLQAQDRRVRLAAARALARYTSAEQDGILPVLMDALAAAASDVEREEAVLDIASLEREAHSALPALVRVYEAAQGDLRFAAAEALAWVAPAVGVRVMPVLLAGLEDRRPDVRRRAASVIGFLGLPALPHKPALERLIGDPVVAVQEAGRAAAQQVRSQQAYAQPLAGLRLKAVVDGGKGRRALFLAGTIVVEAEAGAWIHDGRIQSVEPEGVVVAQDVADERLRLTRDTVRLDLFPGRARPRPAQATRSKEPVDAISISLDSDDLRDLVSMFAVASGLNVVLQSTARCEPVTLQVRAWPWDAALEHILRRCGLAHAVEGSFVRLATKADLARFPYKKEAYTGHPVTMQFSRGRLPDIWQLFADISGLRIEPQPPGESTMWCRECAWDEVFAALARSQGYGYTVDGAVIRLKPLR